MMRYVTIKELSDITRNNLWKIPHDIDIVIGVPRSGMLPATMIALYLNVRLSDIDSFIDGNIFECGERGKYVKQEQIKKVLVVDDSVCGGGSIKKAKAKLAPLSNDFQLIYASPIVTTIGISLVDIYFEVIDEERVFEWNLFHHNILENACIDIDGVLCCNPEEDDDGEKYMAFINNAMPLFTPTPLLNTIITCRLEKYRNHTIDWLQRNNIIYQNLIMLNLPDKASRIKWGKHGEFKGNYYKNSNCTLFIESSYHEAYTIAKISCKPVICTETNELIHIIPTTKWQKCKRKLRKHLPRTYHLLRKAFASNH